MHTPLTQRSKEEKKLQATTDSSVIALNPIDGTMETLITLMSDDITHIRPSASITEHPHGYYREFHLEELAELLHCMHEACLHAKIVHRWTAT